jgi:sorting and assembly machinery component 37
VASHILLLKHAPLLNNHLLPLLKESHPALVEHAERILALAFPTNTGDTVHGDVEVIQAPHANPIIQLGRAVGRTLQAVLPVAASV